MQSYSFLCKPIYWFVWLVFFMLSLFIEPCYTAPSRPPPPVVPPPPAQDYLDKYRRGGPHATTDSPDGQNAIVYNSPHSSLKFYPSAGRLVLHQNHRCFIFFWFLLVPLLSLLCTYVVSEYTVLAMYIGDITWVVISYWKYQTSCIN